MRSIILASALIVLSTLLFAQAPQKMSYQAVIRNNNDVLVANHVIGMRISILYDSQTGTAVYEETQTPTTNANGLATIIIGTGTIVTGTFAGINWQLGPYFLKTETDPAGGTSYSIVGTSQILSVPYALYARSSQTSLDAVKVTGNQTIEGNKKFNGVTTVQTPVNATDAATKAYVDALVQKINQLESQPRIVKDVDGNLYTTIKIGDKVWLAENLKTTRLRDGTSIPYWASPWSSITTPSYCWPGGDIYYKDIYGALYNWYTVNTGKLCPMGWHVPTDAEWTTFENYLIANGYNYDGATLTNRIAKSLASNNRWASSSDIGAVGNTDYPDKRNATGFTALPGGWYSSSAHFFENEVYGYWWTATVYGIGLTTAWCRYMEYNTSNLTRLYYSSNSGLSVRCLED